jgi:hypothetical protein
VTQPHLIAIPTTIGLRNGMGGYPRAEKGTVTLVNFGATTLTGLSVLGVPAGGFTIGGVPGPLQPGQAASLNWSFAGGASPPASFRITTDDPQVSATVNLVQQ